MAEAVIPASPNWYCSKISDSNSNGIYVFAARHDIFCFDCQNFPPKYEGVFLGHREKVTAVSLSEQDQHGGLCCSCSDDGAVRLWQLDNKEIVQEHDIHSCKVTAITWSPVQDDLIITADEQGTVGVWQFQEDRRSNCKPQKACIFTLSASPSNASIVAVGYKNGLILLIDVKRGGLIVTRLRGHDDEIHGLAWCPVPGENFRPQSGGHQDITDLETFGIDDSWRKSPTPVEDTEGFGDEGWVIASGSRDRTIRLWSTAKGRQLHLLKLPVPGRRERTDDSGKTRSWITLHWPKHRPSELLSSSQCGDLLLWDITKTGKEGRAVVLQAGGRGHTRYIFNICPLGHRPDILCTVSMDRQILFWDLSMRMLVGVLPSLGGYVYVANSSPLDPGRVALGVGDGMIRIWNLNSPGDTHDMTSLWQGVRGKVTALSWHPTKDGVLAYGTDDGRVGIYDILSNRPPNISTTYHKRTVYVVSWGPPCPAIAEGKGSKKGVFHVYSIGDGNILQHDPQGLGEEARSVNKLIQLTNPTYRHQTRVPTRSEISWNADYTAVAVGNDDGTIEIYLPPDFRLQANIQVHHKLINSIQWHPHVTMVTPGGSPYKYWLASGSTETQIAIVDTTKLFDGSDTTEGPVQITECLRRLEGHSNRVTGVMWSPHADGQLASVSYDGNAIVWDVPHGKPIACYPGHLGKLLCLQWSGLDPDEVITGGDDFCVHRWKVSKFPVLDGQLGSGRIRKKKKSQKTKSGGQSVAVESLESSMVSMTIDEKQNLEELLDMKRKELMDKDKQERTVEEDDTAIGTEGIPTVESIQVIPTPTEAGDAKSRGSKTDAAAGDKKKRKPKSMFPVSSRQENRGKQYILQDIVTLATLIYGSKTDKNGKTIPVELTEETSHLGLFLDRRAAYSCLNIEVEVTGLKRRM